MNDLIDTNLHVLPSGLDALRPHLPAYWIEQIDNTLFRGAPETYYPQGTISESGGTFGSFATYAEASAHAALGPQLRYGLVHAPYAVDALHNPEQAEAMTRAINDWLIAEWTSRDPRLRATLVLPWQFPDLAVAEVQRLGGHPGFVEAMVPVRSAQPYGHRTFRPVWEAIAAAGLVAGMVEGGRPGNPPTPSGWPSFFAEDYVATAQTFATQITSVIVNGVFDLFPQLRVTLHDSGVTWVPAHMWHTDREWKNLRRQVPWMDQPPSQYLRQYVRLSLASLDAPSDAGPDAVPLQRVLAHLDSDEMLLYASGAPFQTDPHAVLATVAAALPSSHHDKVLRDNALAWYRFDGSGSDEEGKH